MKTVHIERVLLGQIKKDGLDIDTVALLTRRALSDNVAMRVLSRLNGGTVGFVTRPFTNDRGEPDFSWLGEEVLVATVVLRDGLGWRAGALFDPRQQIPATIAAGAVGRLSGAVLRHPDIDPALIVQSVGTNARIRFQMETVEVPVPRSPLTHLRVWTLLNKARSLETNTGSGLKAAITASALTVTAAAVTRIASGQAFTSPVNGVGTAFMLITCTLLGLVAIDALSGRWFSQRLMKRLGKPTVYEMNAVTKQNIWQRQIDKDRGFNDMGAPV